MITFIVSSQTLTLATQSEDAAQYRPRFQSPAAKQATADPTLQRNRIAGNIKCLGNCTVGMLRRAADLWDILARPLLKDRLLASGPLGRESASHLERLPDEEPGAR